jgi:hypothetical protein
MDEFRRLLIERVVLIVLFIALTVIYFWSFSALGPGVPHFLRLLLHIVTLALAFLLAYQIGHRRRRMLEIMGKRH